MIKEIIKHILPNKMVFILNSLKFYLYDINRFIVHSNTYFKLNTSGKVNGNMTMLYHVIEKGLTMPETRLGFGEKVVSDLINVCNFCLSKNYSVNNLVFIHSVEVLNEYVRFHELNNYSLNANIVKAIESIASDSKINSYSTQKEVSENDYFKDINSSFETFCRSRHSIRNFTGKDIPLETIHKCIELAIESPSACNRQPNRVYIIKNRHIIEKTLELQNGNRGFGHLANTLLILTSDISVFQNNDERNEPFLNSGLFGMTLVYALHLFKIGTCFLNWSASKRNDLALRKLISVPNNEQISVIIACGYLPDKFKVSSSPRLPLGYVCHEII